MNDKDFSRYIPFGRHNAISKAELCRLTGFNERSLRDRIKKANAELVKTGFAIISSSQSRGYWRYRYRLLSQVYVVNPLISQVKKAAIATFLHLLWITDDPYEIYMYLQEAERRAMRIQEHNKPVYWLFRQLTAQKVCNERSYPRY